MASLFKEMFDKKNLFTGWEDFDRRMLGFAPGIYVINGEANTGKSQFIFRLITRNYQQFKKSTIIYAEKSIFPVDRLAQIYANQFHDEPGNFLKSIRITKIATQGHLFYAVKWLPENIKDFDANLIMFDHPVGFFNLESIEDNVNFKAFLTKLEEIVLTKQIMIFIENTAAVIDHKGKKTYTIIAYNHFKKHAWMQINFQKNKNRIIDIHFNPDPLNLGKFQGKINEDQGFICQPGEKNN